MADKPEEREEILEQLPGIPQFKADIEEEYEGNTPAIERAVDSYEDYVDGNEDGGDRKTLYTVATDLVAHGKEEYEPLATDTEPAAKPT